MYMMIIETPVRRLEASGSPDEQLPPALSSCCGVLGHGRWGKLDVVEARKTFVSVTPEARVLHSKHLKNIAT